VALLLGRGADIHALNDEALQWAATNGHRDTVALLLGRGADIHAQNDMALWWAATNGHRDTVALLLDRGADIHAEDDAALRWAAREGHRDTVALLLDRGADIHAADDGALRLAAKSGQRNTVKLLLANGADPTWITDVETAGVALAGITGSLQPEMRSEVAARFTQKPTHAQCFRGDEQPRLSEHVLLSCVTGQFNTLVCAPLIASKDQADRLLFRDIWDALPQHWQHEYQNLFMSFVKEGALKPVVGQNSIGVSRQESDIRR
jgi:hypothetical protein